MLTTICNFLSKLSWRIKGEIIGILVLIALCFYTYSLYINYQQTKVDKERFENNFNNAGFVIDSIRTKSGQLVYSVKSLTLKVGEFEKMKLDNENLAEEVKEMNIKLKNVQAVTKIEYKYLYKIPPDSTVIVKKNDSIFQAKFEDNWLKLDETIRLINNKNNVKIDSLRLSLKDSVLIVPEVLYKRYWLFWRKPTGIKVNIKSSNPYFNLDKMQTIQLIK